MSTAVLASGPSPWIVGATIVGLPIALWAYKCLMMVVFQRKIIYMGGIPLGSRSEQLASSDVEEIVIPSDGATLYGIVVSRASAPKPPLVIMYLQGNAGNPLHRIPKFRLLVDASLGRGIKLVAVAPRSYWKSTNKSPSEAGFLSDYCAVLDWIAVQYPRSPVVLYGHSIGGAIAVKLLASLPVPRPQVRGLVLENAFTSVPDMVRTVYPSRWLPYYHLGPLVFDKWDALGALGHPSDMLRQIITGPCSLLILNSANDELVPPQMGHALLEAARAVYNQCEKRTGTGPRRIIVPAALHDDAFTRRQWKDAMRGYMSEIISNECRES